MFGRIKLLELALIFALVLVVGIALMLASSEIQNNQLKQQISEIQTQVDLIRNNNASIVNFSNGEVGPLGGLVIYHTFNITIQNGGNNSISNLTLVVEMFGYNDKHKVWDYIQNAENLSAGEVREIAMGTNTNVDDIMSPPDRTFVVTLFAGNNEIDRYTVNYEIAK